MSAGRGDSGYPCNRVWELVFRHGTVGWEGRGGREMPTGDHFAVN